jgi:hypothetical protein
MPTISSKCLVVQIIAIALEYTRSCDFGNHCCYGHRYLQAFFFMPVTNRTYCTPPPSTTPKANYAPYNVTLRCVIQYSFVHGNLIINPSSNFKAGTYPQLRAPAVQLHIIDDSLTPWNGVCAFLLSISNGE